VTIPAGAFAPGFPPTNVQLPVNVPGQSYTIPAQQFTIPQQDIQLMDEDSLFAAVDAKWLIFDGGMRQGLRRQTAGGLEIAKQEARRTDLEIIDSVKRMYYGSVLARQLHQVGNDTLERMEATLNLTETMYKEGSGTVKKTDSLENKVMVETLRSAVVLLEKNEEMAQTALANTMGMAWDERVESADPEIPNEPITADLTELVNASYRFSPDWAQVEAGIQGLEGSVKESQSGYFPKVALTGSLNHWVNDYDYGMATDRNKENWTVGAVMEFPLFDGFLTRNKVRATRARLNKVKEQQLLLREEIGVQIKDIFLEMNAAQKRFQATLDAKISAEENRDLNTRAYQNELVETEDVIQAQLIEAFMAAQHYKVRYDQVALQSRLNLVVGTEVRDLLEKAPGK